MSDRILYISDLDCTLLNDNSSLSAYTLETINQLVESGLMFTFASARSLSSASRTIQGLKLRLPVITYNGTFIQDAATGERLHSCTFTPDQRRAVAGILESSHISPLVYAFIDGEEKLSWISGMENPGVRHYLGNRRGDRRLHPISPEDSSCAEYGASNRTLYTGDIFYFTCIGTREEFIPVRQALNRIDGIRCSLCEEPGRPGEYWCEIMPAQASKANAVTRLKKILGADKVITFGDAQNDQPMFEVSDECYAVANACAQLKQMATGIIGSNTDDGVARYLSNQWTSSNRHFIR